MLKKVRSSYILNIIFNYMDNTRKLKTVVYNKKIQQKLGLNLIDYRRLSGRYKEEEDGKIIIYNSYNDWVLFEGQYSNGKRNGEGKEYNEDGKLIFEGEYLNGKKWTGKAKEYDEDTGKLILKCEYLNGKIDGKIKEYDKYNGDLLFSGKYSNGKRNGKGTEYKSILYEDSGYLHSSNIKSRRIKIFSGVYLNGKRKKGKEYNYDGKIIYEGDYLNDQRNGKGKIYYKNDKLKYEGEFMNGLKNGKGVLYNRNHDIKYEGEILNGKKNGKGKVYKIYNNYSIYNTEYKSILYEDNKYNHYSNSSNIKSKSIKIFSGKYLNGKEKKEKNIIMMKN